MKTKETTHPAVIKLFQQLGKEMSEHHQMENGVYNSADPTAYSKGKMDFTHDGRVPYHLEYVDCTWGIEFTVYLYHPHEAWDGNNNDPFLKYFHKKTIGGFYLTQDEKVPRVVYRDNEPGLILLLYQCFKDKLNLRPDHDNRVYMSEFEEDEDVWTDPAGGIHYKEEQEEREEFLRKNYNGVFGSIW